MRSGLLAVGLILLVLGIIFYFVPPATASTTSTTDNGYVGQQVTNTDTTTGTMTTTTTDGQTQTGSAQNTVYATVDPAASGTTDTTSSTTGTDTSSTGATTSDTSSNAGTTGTTSTSSPTTTTTSTTTPVTTTTSSGFFSRLFGPSSSTTTTSSYSNLALQQQLSVIAMILGAVLTILGLVLPDPVHTHVTTARTTGAPARRVVEEEEIRRRP